MAALAVAAAVDEEGVSVCETADSTAVKRERERDKHILPVLLQQRRPREREREERREEKRLTDCQSDQRATD